MPLRGIQIVKKLYYMLIIALMAPLFSGCTDNSSSASPPKWLPPTPGDGRVKLEWIPSSGVDYWIFTATDPSLSAFNWTGLPNSHAYTSARTPFYLCGLFSGTLSNGTVSPLPYYFAANGRINGGAGGSSSPTITATPYNASTIPWTAPVPPANGVLASTNLNGLGYTSLTICSNNAMSASGSFAAVGAGGAIFTSTDGQNWSPSTPPLAVDLYAVAGYAARQNNPVNPGLRWVAVGAGGASIYSTDGSNWLIGRPDLGNPALRSVTQVAGKFFAVGDSGTILSSNDGITWTAHTSGTTAKLNGVTHGAHFIAVGDSGTILISANGNIWAAITSIPSIASINLRQVTSFGSIIVAVGDGGTIVTSKDSGTTWTALTLPGATNLIGVATEIQLVEHAPKDSWLGFISTAQFVAVDDSGNAWTSVNGHDWALVPAVSPSTTSTGASGLNALVSSGFGYVAAGNLGATAYAF
jgi:photosystem II stability/assembly factor-like uncharacterized protein